MEFCQAWIHAESGDAERVGGAIGARSVQAGREAEAAVSEQRDVAFGRMRYKPPASTLEALCSATAREMSAFRADELSGMMLGLAHLDHVPSREFLGEARRFIEKHLRRFDDAAACNILWAFARMEMALSGDIIDALLIQLTSQNFGGGNSHVSVPMCMYARALVSTTHRHPRSCER